MKEFKTEVGKISPKVFKEMNQVLTKHGIKNTEIVNIKLKPDTDAMRTCPPGKQLYYYVDAATGKTHCRCI